MLPDIFYGRIVAPCLEYMAASPGIAIPATDAARVLVMAIAGQEGLWKHRRQVGGPARSYWQGEKTGGMILAVRHAATAAKAVTLLRALDIGEPDLNQWVMPTDQTIYEALAWSDPLACGLARLLLYSDPAPLPAVGDRDAAWAYYLRNWRPGLPHPESWPGVYGQAVAAVCGRG